MKRKPFSIVLIILIVSVLLSGYTIYKSQLLRLQDSNSHEYTSDQAKNWKTYSSNLGFSFKYPDDFSDVNKNGLFREDEVKMFVKNDQYSIVLRLSSDTKTYNIENLKTLSKSIKNMDFHTAYLTSGVAAGGEVFSTIVIPLNNYFIDISIDPNDSDDSKVLETEKLQNEILSTFKFIE